MIQKIKEMVGDNAELIIANGLGLQKKGKNYCCPNALEHKRGDKNPSMGWDSKALQFYCFTCGKKIDIYQFYREQGMEHKEILEKFRLIEDKPKFELEPITEECIKYLESRKITKDTIKHFGLKSYKGNIAFPYLSGGQVVGVKYRQPRKIKDGPKYLSIKGSEFTFFNKQNINQWNELIICEGEIDCMVLSQCGYEAVSVGTGANAIEKLLTTEKEYLRNFQTIIIISDNDEAGKKMEQGFLKALGPKVKLVDKKLFTEKDINEEYYKHGQAKITEIIESARTKIEGLRNLDTMPYKGMEAIKGKYIPTGIKTIDFALNDLAPQCVTLITGRSNDGKSTFVNQIIANAIDHDNSVLLVSGEGIQEIIINNLYRSIIGRDESLYDYKKINKRKFKEPKPEVIKALKQWHKGKLTLFNKGDSPLKTTDQLMELITYEIKTNRHHLVVIDNLMSILSVEKASEKLEAQADFMQRCCDIAKAENTHIILVLHPNKTLQKNASMDFEQISGTQDLPNKADNIIVVRKEHDKETRATGVSGDITVVKNRYFPDLPKVKIHYEEETGLLLEIDEKTNQFLAYNFGWRQYMDDPIKRIGKEVEVPDWLL